MPFTCPLPPTSNHTYKLCPLSLIILQLSSLWRNRGTLDQIKKKKSNNDGESLLKHDLEEGLKTLGGSPPRRGYWMMKGCYRKVNWTRSSGLGAKLGPIFENWREAFYTKTIKNYSTSPSCQKETIKNAYPFLTYPLCQRLCLLFTCHHACISWQVWQLSIIISMLKIGKLRFME